MAGEYMQSIKVVMILCSCFFAYGTYWSNWAFDYYFLWADLNEHPNAVARATQYYITHMDAPDILKYIPFANLMIAAFGFAAGLATWTDGNILFDGAALVLMLFALSTYATSVRPAMLAIKELDSDNIKELTSNLKNIAAAHFIIVLAITGIIGLQITHYVLTKREERAERNAAMEAKKTK